jgi:hypothetical protein
VVTESVIPATVSFGKVNAQFVMGLKCTNAKNVGKKNVSMNVVIKNTCFAKIVIKPFAQCAPIYVVYVQMKLILILL